MKTNAATATANVMTQSWLTLEEIANDLRLPLSTIYQWRTVGRGPKGIKVGKHVRVSRREYDAWLQALSLAA